MIYLAERYWTFLSLFYVLTCITSFRYLLITCNEFIACYNEWMSEWMNKSVFLLSSDTFIKEAG